MKYLNYTLVLFTLFLFQEPLLSFAEYIDPAKVTVKTEKYSPAVMPSERGKYEYKVAWQGIPVARATVDVHDALLGENPYLSVTAEARTSGPVSIFYRLDHTSQSLIDSKDLQPKMFRTNEKINSRKQGRFISFGEDGRIHFRRWKEGTQPLISEFFSDNATFDPISASIVARTLPIDENRFFSFDVFNGKHRYEISFHVQEKEEIKVDHQTRLAFKVVPGVKKLTDSEGEKKLESATLWISADDKREILKIESKVWIGKVTATLSGFKENNEIARISQSQLAMN